MGAQVVVKAAVYPSRDHVKPGSVPRVTRCAFTCHAPSRKNPPVSWVRARFVMSPVKRYLFIPPNMSSRGSRKRSENLFTSRRFWVTMFTNGLATSREDGLL